MVEDGAFSNKIDYVIIFYDILNLDLITTWQLDTLMRCTQGSLLGSGDVLTLDFEMYTWAESLS